MLLRLFTPPRGPDRRPEGIHQHVDPVAVRRVDVAAEAEGAGELHRHEAVGERGHEPGSLEGAVRSDESRGDHEQRCGGLGGLVDVGTGARRQVHEEQLVRARVASREAAKGGRNRAKRGGRVGLAGQGLQLASQVLLRGGRDRGDERAAVRNALVERRCPDANALRHRLHRDGLQATFLEEVASRGDDLVAGRPGSGRAHAFSRPMRPRCVSWNEPGSFMP